MVSVVSLKSASTAKKSTRVLLIEDDQVDRMAFERLVSKTELPYDYSLATNLRDALAALESTPFDIIISDYHLPDGTALDLFRRQLDLPIIVITGAGDERIAVQAMRAGASDYLIKDLERNYLAILPITVENALRKRSMDGQLRTLSHAVENINEALYICDPQGRITYVNSAFLSTYGYSREKILDTPRDRLWAAGFAVPTPLFGSSLSDARDQLETVHRRHGGEDFPVLVSRSILKDLAGEDLAEVGVVWDITERKRAETALRESEMRYALATRGANDGLWDWDLRSGKLYFSSRWKSMLGYSEDEVGGSLDDWLRLVHPEDVELLKAQLDSHLEGLTSHFENEHRIRHRNGSYRWALSRGLGVREGAGRPYRMAGSQTDITERKRAEQQLLHDALHDSLTGLPNRVLFQDRLSSALTRSRRRRSYLFAVLFLDLDRFKVINDSLGHLVGDELLVRVSRRLESCLRIGDTVARLGGDEFAILIDDIDRIDDATDIAQRVQAEFLQPFELDGHEVFTSASIGIALSNVGYRRAEDILRDADTAMYRAKARAENVPVVFDPEMHTSALLLLRLENDLRRALEREEFELHFQPIYRLPAGSLWGFESLLRWRHPKRGLICPDDYLPWAEETGLILPLGDWVLRQACRQAVAWRKLPGNEDLIFSVNVSGRQLTQQGFAAGVRTTMREEGLEAPALHVEITEKVMIDQPDAVQQTLGELRQQGIQLHIDDFGTGYSSLSQLHRFPVDKLKIDRTFVKGLGPGGESNEIVRTIIALAHALNLEVMAEGVETEPQLEMVQRLECEYGQGFLFSRPLDTTEVERWFADSNRSERPVLK